MQDNYIPEPVTYKDDVSNEVDPILRTGEGSS